MNTFTIYNLDSGEISYTTTTDTPIDVMGLQEGEGIIIGGYQSNEHIIIDGEAVTRTDNVLEVLRSKRDSLLTQSDWTQMPDSPLSSSKKTEWATYRQALRDLPATNSDATSIDDVVFPNQPQ
jgi:hypothetical protein